MPQTGWIFWACPVACSRCGAIRSGCAVIAGHPHGRCRVFGTRCGTRLGPTTSRVWRRKSGPSPRSCGAGASTFARATRTGTARRLTPMGIRNWSGVCGENTHAGARDIGPSLRPSSRREGGISATARLCIRSARRLVHVVGKPDAGALHVRFDAGALETGRGDGVRHRHWAKAAGNSDSPDLRPPRQLSTLPGAAGGGALRLSPVSATRSRIGQVSEIERR
jgi:hypothetical protein